MDDIEKLTESVRQLPLQGAQLSSSYFYSSLCLCVIDSVFSIGVRYGSVVNVVSRVVQCAEIERDRRLIERDPLPISDFIRDYDDTIFGSSQRTSTRGGILKSEAARSVCQTFTEIGLNELQNFREASDELLKTAETRMRAVKGQKSGISWSYLRMLAGDDSQIKPDRHILRYIHSSIGKTVIPEDATSLLRKVCAKLRDTHPTLTPRLLDHLIWNVQSGRT